MRKLLHAVFHHQQDAAGSPLRWLWDFCLGTFVRAKAPWSWIVTIPVGMFVLIVGAPAFALLTLLDFIAFSFGSRRGSES